MDYCFKFFNIRILPNCHVGAYCISPEGIRLVGAKPNPTHQTRMVFFWIAGFCHTPLHGMFADIQIKFRYW